MKVEIKGVRMRKVGWVLALLAVAVLSAWGQKVKPLLDEDGVYLSSKGVSAAKLVHSVPAVALEDPRLEGLKHICALNVVIGADGIPAAMEIVNKVTTPFDNAAKAAVRQSQFEPGSFEGKPVPTRLMVWVPFLGKGHPALPVAGSAKDLKDLKSPVPIFTPDAEFSEAARFLHKGGVVLVRILVTEEGLPTRERVLVHAEHGLDEKALEAVKKYRFRPAFLEGVPVPVMMSIEVNF